MIVFNKWGKLFLFLFVLNREAYYPGDTVAVKIGNISSESKIRCFFHKKEYPVFFVGKDTARILIGLPADIKKGEYKLILVRGEKRETRTVKIKGKSFKKQRIILSEEKEKLYSMTDNDDQRVILHEKLKTRTERQEWLGKFIIPAKGNFGDSFGAIRGKRRHKGIDITNRDGSPVLASNNGKVILTGDFNLEGKTVMVDHGQGVITLYIHLSSILVENGKKVLKKEKIGLLGNSGISTQPHLHWALYIHGQSVNPLVWTKEEF